MSEGDEKPREDRHSVAPSSLSPSGIQVTLCVFNLTFTLVNPLLGVGVSVFGVYFEALAKRTRKLRIEHKDSQKVVSTLKSVPARKRMQMT